MTELTPKTILESIEVIRAVKSLFVEQSPYLPMYSALGGAFIGAISSFFPTFLINKLKDNRERKSITLQIYAEIKATLVVTQHRNYIEQLENIVAAFDRGEMNSLTYQIQVREDIFPIFKHSLDRLGNIDIDIQTKVVEFYQLIEAVIQDVRPGGMLNTQPATRLAFSEALHISKMARDIGNDILHIIEKRYKF